MVIALPRIGKHTFKILQLRRKLEYFWWTSGWERRSNVCKKKQERVRWLSWHFKNGFARTHANPLNPITVSHPYEYSRSEKINVGSVAQCLESRFYNDYDRKVNGSTLNLVSLLRPWIRCFTMIISAWWNLASSQLKKSDRKIQPENLETKATPKRVWIHSTHSAYAAFSW